MSIPDELLAEWLALASGLRGDDLAGAVTAAQSEPYRAKRDLAARIVVQYHGPTAAEEAAARFDLKLAAAGFAHDEILQQAARGDIGLELGIGCRIAGLADIARARCELLQRNGLEHRGSPD